MISQNFYLWALAPEDTQKIAMFLVEYIQHHSTRIKKVSPANSWTLKTYLKSQTSHLICGTLCVCVFVCFFFQDGFKRFPKMWSLWSCLHLDDLAVKTSRFSGHQPVLFIISICPWRTGDPGAKRRGLRVQSLFAAGLKRLISWFSSWMGFEPFHAISRIYLLSVSGKCRYWRLAMWLKRLSFRKVVELVVFLFSTQLDWKVALRSSYPFNSHLLCLGWSQFTTLR